MNKNETYDKAKNQTEKAKDFSDPHLPLSSKRRFEFNFRNQAVVFEIDHLATKSDKSILCRYGNTTILTVLTTRQLTEPKSSFFPLTITFEEKFYAIGRIPSMFAKREGRPSYDAITTARLIDRSLRSLFELPTQQEVHITNLVLTVDPHCDPRMVAAWNSTLVCFLSPNLPSFDTPLATVIQHHPSEENLVKPVNFNSFSLEIILSATEEKIVMLEVKGKEVQETKILNFINSAHQEIRSLIGFFRTMANSLRIKKVAAEVPQISPIRNETLTEKINSQLALMLFQSNLTWIEKEKKMKECREILVKEFRSQNPQWEEDKVKNMMSWKTNYSLNVNTSCASRAQKNKPTIK